MSDEIIKVLFAQCEKFGVVIDWSAENVLPYAQQLCERLASYEIATSIMWLVIVFVLTIIAGIMTAIFVPKAIKDEWDNEWPAVPAMFSIVILCGVVIVLFVVGGIQANDIITCCTFPEKIVFDYLTSIM